MNHMEPTINSSANYVFCPVETDDYRIERGKFGLGMVANRDIKKGEDVFDDSMEFCFRDVKEGDFLLFVKDYKYEHKEGGGGDSDAVIEEKKTDKGDHGEEKDVPLTYPIDEDTLFETHGLPMLVPNPDKASEELKERWILESPGMLIDHSCDPNVCADDFDFYKGRAIATRDIFNGEPLTCDYAAFDYEEDGTTFECQCEAEKCRKKNNGFEFMTAEEKERMLSEGVSDVVKARHKHSLGLGPPVSFLEDITMPRSSNAGNVPRLVTPGPSFSQETATPDVAIRPCEPTTRDDTVEFGLFAMQDFKKGSRVYWYWSQPWPTFPNGIENSVIDMVSAMELSEGDLPEGTVVRIDPRLCASREAKSGSYNFTCFDLLTHHSCDPNIVYDPETEEKLENWRCAHACRDIQKGDQLYVDFNCCMWDRTAIDENNKGDMKNCKCGSDNCRGTAQGFCHLTREVQDELYAMNWRRAITTKEQKKGKALSAFIRKQLQERNSN